MRAVLLSTYELGRQPFGLASPAAWLRAAGADVRVVDASRQRVDDAVLGGADLVGFHLPMHTATRLALPLVARVRRLASGARICAFGLYAPLNAPLLVEAGVDDVLGVEFEADLVALAQSLDGDRRAGGPRARGVRVAGSRDGGAEAAGPRAARRPLPRLAFHVPDRRDLPPLDRYARLVMGAGRRLTAGYTEASRGCKHRCRHCPIVPVYDGQFRVVPVDVVVADVAQQVDAGARHVTFGDPDFFNGITHARRVVREFAARFPGTTYDVTIKVEHLVTHAADLPLLRETGCVFVTSAVESIDDRVLGALRKGHTRRDAERAVALCRDAGLALVPTFVPFSPWTTRDGYLDLLEWIAAEDLVEHVAPVQLVIRLLLTSGAPLLDDPVVRAVAAPFDRGRLVHPWTHPDPALDVLQRDLEAMVAASAHEPRTAVFDGVRALAHERLRGERLPPRGVVADAVRTRAEVPWLDEPWYC